MKSRGLWDTLESCRWAEQAGDVWMWKVTPVGMQNACCAGARLVANTNELPAHGNPVPATAPRRYVCACANTCSLFSSLHWFILATDQISTCRSLQLGTCGGTARGLMAEPRHCRPESGETITITTLGWLLLTFRRALQQLQPMRIERPPSSRWGTYVTSVGAVVCRLWLQAGRHGNGLGFFAYVAVRASEHPLAFKSRHCKTALHRWGFVKHVAGFASSSRTKCYSRWLP